MKPILRLCVRVSSNPNMRNVVPGSVIERCSRCDSAVWMDPSQEMPSYLKNPEVLVCLHCAADDPEIGPHLQKVLVDSYEDLKTYGTPLPRNEHGIYTGDEEEDDGEIHGDVAGQ